MNVASKLHTSRMGGGLIRREILVQELDSQSGDGAYIFEGGLFSGDTVLLGIIITSMLPN